MTRTIVAIALLVAVCLFASMAAQGPPPTNVRIMAGLDNPRGLALGPAGLSTWLKRVPAAPAPAVSRRRTRPAVLV